MKNYKILFTLIVTLLFISCNSPKSDAEKVCDCFSELDNKKSDENKEIKEKIETLKGENSLESSLEVIKLTEQLLKNNFGSNNECIVLQDEILKKYNGDSEKTKEYYNTLETCKPGLISNITKSISKYDNNISNLSDKVNDVKKEIETKYYLYCVFSILFGIVLSLYGLRKFSLSLSLSFFIPSIVVLGMINWLNFNWFIVILILTILIFLLSKILIYFNAWFFITILISLPFAMLFDDDTLNTVVKISMLISIPIVYFIRHDIKKIIIGFSGGFSVGFGLSGIFFAQSISDGNILDSFLLPGLIMFSFMILGVVYQYKEKLLPSLFETNSELNEETSETTINENIINSNKINYKKIFLIGLGLIVISTISILMFKTPNNEIKEETKQIETRSTNKSIGSENQYDSIVTKPIEDIETTDINSDITIDVIYYHIEDPDGFSNLRDVPGGKVIRKVYPNENFELLEEVDNHYLVKFNDNSQGYIHKSRVFKS